MNGKTTRRQAILAVAACAGASTVAINDVSANADHRRPPDIELPTGFMNEHGEWIVPIRVIAGDDLTPIEGLRVEIEQFAISGSRIESTDSNGMIFLHQGTMFEATYWLNLTPGDGTRFAAITETLTIRADGTYFPNLVRLPFYETAIKEMEIHAVKRTSAKI